MSAQHYKYIIDLIANDSKLNGQLNGMVGKFNKLIALGGAIGGAMALNQIVGKMTELAKISDVQAKAEAQLLTALKGREDVTSNIIAQAQQLQRVTLFGDEETIRAQSLIAAFVKEEEQLKAVIPLVQDLAAAKQMDLASAADLVSKTLGSEVNALGRYGIQVEGAVGSTERLTSLMQGLDAAFGGQARTLAQSGLGPYQQWLNVQGDLREEIGAKFMPLLNAYGQAMMELTGNGQTLADVFDAQSRRLQGIERDLVPMIARYEELGLKTTHTNAEHEEFEKLIQEIGKAIPTAVTGLDEYGRVLGISTTKAKDFLEQQRLLLQYTNRAAIKEQEEALKTYDKQLAGINQKLKRGGEYRSAFGQTTFDAYSPEDLANFHAAAAEIGQNKLQTENLIRALKGLPPVASEAASGTGELTNAGKEQARTLTSIEEEIAQYEAKLKTADVADKANLLTIHQKIAALKEEKAGIEGIAEAYAQQAEMRDLKAHFKGTATLSGLDAGPLQSALPGQLQGVNLRFTPQVDRDIIAQTLAAYADAEKYARYYGGTIGVLEEQHRTLNQGLQAMITEGIDPMSPAFQVLIEQLEEVESKLVSFDEKTRQMKENASLAANTVMTSFDVMSQGVIDSLAANGNAMNAFEQVMFKGITRIIAMLTANAISNAIVMGTVAGKATGPAAPFTTPAFIAQAVGTVVAAFSTLPKFAEGGLVYGPTLGLFGEYPGAAGNPEVVAPLDKLKGMMGERGGRLTLEQGYLEFDGMKMRQHYKLVEQQVNNFT